MNLKGLSNGNKRALMLSICVLSASNSPLSEAFVIPSTTLHPTIITPKQESRHVMRMSTVTPEQGKHGAIQEESNFWYAVRRSDPGNANLTKIPHHNNLDFDGALPDDCYNRLGDPIYEPKPNCLVAIDISQTTEDDDILSYLHECIDAGLATIHGGTANSYNVLVRDTPRTVLNRCNWVSTVHVPTEALTSSSSSLRNILLQPLHDMGGAASCLDTLQLCWNPKSPYFLDLLDVAIDLQREGVIRSIVGRRLPPDALRQAHACGFSQHVESNQIPVHLLDPCQYYTPEMLLAASDTNTKLVVETPLAGGLFADRHYHRPTEPYKFELRRSERDFIKALYQWSRRRRQQQQQQQRQNGDSSAWNDFQSNMLSVLLNISRKHQAGSMETVALRWALELQQVSSAVVMAATTNEGWPEEPSKKSQPSELRQVFGFELDEEDAEQLWKAAGFDEPPTSQQMPPSVDFDDLNQERSNRLFRPSPSGKLYL